MSDHTGSVNSRGERARLLVLLFVLASLAAADFVLTVTHAIQPLDREATGATHRFAPTWLTPPMIGFTLLGEDVPLDVFAAVVAFAALRRGHRLDAALLVAVALLARLIGLVMKNATRQPRPLLLLSPQPLRVLHTFGYPSGHALLSIAILGFAAVLIGRLLARSLPCVFVAAVFALLVFCIGWSRVYLGFHWLNDVVGGYLARWSRDRRRCSAAERLPEGIRAHKGWPACMRESSQPPRCHPIPTGGRTLWASA